MSIAKRCEITVDDLHDAYRLCRLRRLGIGFEKALSTPHIAAGLRGTAMVRKMPGNSKPEATPETSQQPLKLEIA